MKNPLRAIGGRTLDGLAETGRLWQLTARTLDRAFLGPLRGDKPRWRSTFEQVLRAGNRSLPLVALLTFLVGMILALQSAYQLRQLGLLRLVADLVAVSVTRELAPLLTAILVAGRVGSALAAELGTMRVSQEVDALTVIGIDPTSFLVVPRLLGLLIALPCLTIFGDLVGLFGGFSISVTVLGLSPAGYLNDTLNALTLQDVWGGLLKAFVFAGIIGLIGCQRGLETRGGAEAVGRSTTSAVVDAIILIIAADLFVTALLYVSR